MIAAADIGGALGGKCYGRYWLCSCPAHDDRTPSLSVSDGDDGTVLVKCHAGCGNAAVIEALRLRGLWPDARAGATNFAAPDLETARRQRESDKIARVQRIWRETVDPLGTWADEYLHSRGLRFPANSAIRRRVFGFHANCPFPNGRRGSALIAVFDPICTRIPRDPFEEPCVEAIHRIRGRGKDYKAMLGTCGGRAVMLNPWWELHETLHVCEGVETALALYNEGARDPEDEFRPIWALGSAGAMAAFPVISRVRHLLIHADNDASGTGLNAAYDCARRWSASGRRVSIHMLDRQGADYGER